MTLTVRTPQCGHAVWGKRQPLRRHNPSGICTIQTSSSCDSRLLASVCNWGQNRTMESSGQLKPTNRTTCLNTGFVLLNLVVEKNIFHNSSSSKLPFWCVPVCPFPFFSTNSWDSWGFWSILRNCMGHMTPPQWQGQIDSSYDHVDLRSILSTS